MVKLFEIHQNEEKFVKLQSTTVLCNERIRLRNSACVAEFCDSVLNIAKYATEHFYVLPILPTTELLGVIQISSGGNTFTVAPPDKIFQAALLFNSVELILVHNHPSGDSTPSKEDITATENLVRAGKLLGINVCDHVILGNKEYYSIISKDGGKL